MLSQKRAYQGKRAPETTTRGPDGALLLERPFKRADFYVFVASSTALAERCYNELVGLGQTPDTFDLRTENVLVSSDSSFTETGMSAEKKARIRAAMRALGL